jgi:hypothetical protein
MSIKIHENSNTSIDISWKVEKNYGKVNKNP